MGSLLVKQGGRKREGKGGRKGHKVLEAVWAAIWVS